MSKRTRLLVGLVLSLCVLLGSAALLRTGVYGWTVFIVLPLWAGALASLTFCPTSSARAIGIGALTGAVGCCLFLLVNIEGMMCLAMSLPVIVPLSALGSLLAYQASGFGDRRPGIAMVLLLPASFWFDATARPPVFAVRTSIVVNAPPERVWKNVVSFSDIPDPEDWFFRTGLAYPKRARIEGSGAGAVRYCEFSTGSFVEPIVVWDEPHLLQFRVSANAPSMEETGLYGRIYPKHLTGYFISKRVQFQLTALPHGRTLLEGTTWYQHGL